LTGEIAALGTALLFAFSSTFFTLAGRRAGGSTVNRSRLMIASLVAMILHWVTMGGPLPLELAQSAWLWLALSGIIGLAIGDDFLFRAFVLIGPAMSMLIFALAPAIAAVLGWVLFGESLSALEVAGIVLTLTGVASVVTAPERPSLTAPRSANTLGVLLALGGALGQALGLITAKLGLNAGASAQSANTIRLVAAAAAIWMMTLLAGKARENVAIWVHHRGAAAFMLCGALVGPVAGVWLSLVAIEHAAVGVASTLMSLTPLVLLPIARVVFHQPITARAVFGTAVALAGVAVLIGT